MIQKVVPTIGYNYDSKYFIHVMKGLKSRYVVADKVFDSTASMIYAIKKRIRQVIGIKRNVETGIRARLSRVNKLYEKVYHQRSKEEAVVFVIKRKFGDAVYSRSYSLLRKELFNTVCYNVYREINQLIITFLQG